MAVRPRPPGCLTDWLAGWLAGWLLAMVGMKRRELPSVIRVRRRRFWGSSLVRPNSCLSHLNFKAVSGGATHFITGNRMFAWSVLVCVTNVTIFERHE